MNRKQRIIVSITGIFLVLLILVGLTYAYFLTKIKGNANSKSISVTTANLKLVYNDGSDGVIGGELLEPSNTEYTKTFTVKNEGNKNVTYGVYLINVINTFERKDDIKYIMSCSTDGDIKCNEVTEEVTFPSGIKQLITNEIEPDKTHTYTFKFTYKDTGTDQSIDMNKELSAKIQIFGANGTGEIIPYEEGTFAYTIYNNAKNATGDKTIYQETPTTSPGNAISTFKFLTDPDTVLEKNASTMSVSSTYQEYYWIYGTNFTIDENTGKVTLTGVNSLSSSSKTYANMYSDLVGKYLISNYASGNSVADTSIANPITISTTKNTSIYKVTNATLSRITYKKILLQTVGIEKTLSKSEDDYGDSYYYRGKVVDNYVNFAGMCWRIVRIEGDGSVKLILEDQNTTCNSSSYTGNWNLGNANFGYDSSTYPVKYVINYLNPVTIASNSLVNKFKTFQIGTLTTNIKNTYNKELSDYLKAGDWCYDDTAYASDTSTNDTPLTNSEKEDYYNGIKKDSFYYDSYIRLGGQGIRTPMNKCNGTILNKFNDNTEMYVATLTADEIVFAGIANNAKPSLFDYESYSSWSYLINNNQILSDSIQMYSISPYYYSYSSSFTFSSSFRLIFNGGFGGNMPSNESFGSRPSIQLKSTIGISEGDGTQQNPYVVK